MVQENQYQSLSEAAASPEAPRIKGRRISTNALWRWAREGVKSRSGERIRLRHVRIGGQLFVEPGALAEFFAAVAESDRKHFAERDSVTSVTPSSKPRPPSAARREREIAEAEARLAKAGI